MFPLAPTRSILAAVHLELIQYLGGNTVPQGLDNFPILGLHHIANQGLDSFPILGFAIFGVTAQYSSRGYTI